ncbi:MAG: MBL fold metallo-hydrolase [Leptospirales bacterium]|nr:MBL fold metallo-hydrolase [Leptospirales bacterium]
MNAIFLGTNGWYGTGTGDTICTLIKTNDYDIVFDAGSGFYKIDKYIDGTKPVYLFLSHYHFDHISGLHGLSKIRCNEGLFIAGQPGIGSVMNVIANRPFTIPLNELGYSVKVLELPNDKDQIPFDVKALPLLHSDPCFGYRITVDGLNIVFCTDTGYCDNAVELSLNADFLIAECSFLPKEENRDWPHLNPETAARIASESHIKKLILTHFDSTRYTDIKMRKIAEEAAMVVFPRVLAAVDLMDIELWDMDAAGYF